LVTKRKAGRRPDTPAGHARVPSRTIVWLVVGATLAGVAVWGVTRWRHAAAANSIPAPPTLSGQFAAVTSHLSTRYDAAQRDPGSTAAVGPLCIAYHADMFFDLADRCYAHAADLDPDDWRWEYSRALIQFERGGGQTLVRSLRRVVQLAPRFAPAWLRLGEAEFKAQQYDAAREAWQRVSELKEPDASESGSPTHVAEVPLAAYAGLGLARVALVRGEADRAREILEGLAGQVPHFGSVLRLLADSYRASGRTADADRLIYRASRLPPYAPFADPVVDRLARDSRNSTFLLRLASEADLAMNAEWSEYLTRRALEFDPQNPDVVVKLARILRTIGRNEEALEYFHEYHRLVPGDFLGLAHIGSCLSAMGRYDEAETYLLRALMGTDDAVTHYNLGLLLSQTGRVEAAIGEYQKALTRDPGNSDARMNLAAALMRQGRVELAGRELTQLLERDPDNAVARTNLGIVFLQQGRVDRARAELERALQIDAGLAPARAALESLRSSQKH
jgi:tetratricopeptide (TPR) repeat protein